MTSLKHALRALGLALFLPGLGPLAAQVATQVAAPGPAETFLPGAGFLPGNAADFKEWMDGIEHRFGPLLPETLVHSTPIRFYARKPLYNAKGYPLLDADGQQQCAQVEQSGRVFLPPTWRVPTQRSLPLVVYPHATTMTKHSVASEFGGHEWILGAAAALYYGFAVAMPDLPGMGVDAANYHPFCHAKSLAYATVDGIPTMQGVFEQDPCLREAGYSWDGRLYLLGYSEGAFAAMAAARELDANAASYASKGKYTLTGSACMAGPFDLSGLTRADIINPMREYQHCFYLPYILRSYNAIYGQIIDPLEAFAPVLLEHREDGDILQWTDGTRNGLAVDQLIAKRLGVPGNRVVFRNLLNPAWLAKELDDPAYATSTVNRLLSENDLHRGWAPSKPILFAQSPHDEDLPYQNTVATIGYLAAEIQKAGRDPHKLLASIPIGTCEDAITHTQGAPLAIAMGFDWIYRGMPMQ